MSPIPAWKRAGLSVQHNKTQEDENDLLETRRIDTAELTKNQLKKSVINVNYKKLLALHLARTTAETRNHRRG